jgi:hypothetical protein
MDLRGQRPAERGDAAPTPNVPSRFVLIVHTHQYGEADKTVSRIGESPNGRNGAFQESGRH